jgi:flagellar biosynthesis/type III secretory pathway M-ring protein FliF/YscJ
MEAAIKRALEGAAQACEDIRQRQIMGPMPERACFDQEQTIRALDPAQFIEEPKP